MQIAQPAPLFESVPPRSCGGTECVVACLMEALVDRGQRGVKLLLRRYDQNVGIDVIRKQGDIAVSVVV